MVRRAALAVLLVAWHAAAAEEWQGTPLADYIDSLRSRGLSIIYSTDLVRPSYRVQSEPVSQDPEQALRDVLAPYGLTITPGPAGTLLVTRSAAPKRASSVNVRVVDATDGSGIAGARVDLDGRPAGITDESGQLRLPDIAEGAHRVTASAEGYSGQADAEFRARVAADTVVRVTLDPDPVPLPEIIVASSRYDIRYREAGSHTFLDRELTTRLPHLGDEALRTLARLPGAAGGGVSSRQHVRGGQQNEQLFLLDGLRLYEPYHLKDFHSITTTVDPAVIAGIDFYSAGYQARYGDRMSGVVEIALREPPQRTETELGLTLFHTSALSRGRFGRDDGGDWMLSARRANLDVLADIVNPDYGSPRYHDYLAHIGWDFGRHYLSGNALFSYDKILLSQPDGSERAAARYANDVFWLKAESEWNERLESTTVVSATEIDNERSGETNKPGAIEGFVDDEREFRSLALKQDWLYEVSDRWLLRAGFELKRLEADYRYASSKTVAPPFDAILDNQPSSMRLVETSPAGGQYAAYTELRWRPVARVALDLGLRWDQQTYTSAMTDEQVSPRTNLLWRVTDNTEFRLAWGRYYQAQEINELQVSDGLDEFRSAQRATHIVASLKHHLPAGLELRVEAYRKKYDHVAPRFENLFDPLVLIPELQIDRVRIDADEATARGIEVTLSGGGDHHLAWWASYAWSQSVDQIDGRGVRRSWDQRHSLSAGISRDWHHWSLSAAAIARSGWPRTVLTGETIRDPDGTAHLDLAVGPRNDLRHDVFQSLDVRVSRRFDLPRGELTAFLEVTNLLNRENACCTEYSAGLDENGDPALIAEQGNWLPLVPSLGVLWRF